MTIEPASVEAESRSDVSSLLQFIATLNHTDNLDQVLSRMLRRATRQIGVKRTAALVLDRKERFVVRAAKGRGLRRLLGKRIEITESANLSPFYYADQLGSSLIRSLRPVLNEFPAMIIAPIVRGDRLLGFLLFDGKVSESPFSESDLEFLTLFASVTAAAIETSLAQSEMRRANQRLSVRTQQLYTLFDVVREINLANNTTEINRLLINTLLSQTAINGCGVFTLVNGKLRFGLAHGIDASGEDVAYLLNTTLLGPLLAHETPMRPGGFENRAGSDALRRWGIDYLVPMKSREQTRGLLAISLTASRSELTDEELEFIATLGNQAIIALENLRLREEMLIKERLEREVSIARRIQQTLLPDECPQISGYEFAAMGESYSEVGGDYYDFIQIDDHRIGIAIADVTGKGIPASLLMASVHATVRALAISSELECSEIVRRINRLLYQNVRAESFVTFFFGILDTRDNTFVSVNAGHCYPLLIKANGRTINLREGGLVLGLVEDSIYESEMHIIDPGDLLLLYTDGLSEIMSRDDNEMFGDRRMMEVIACSRQEPSEMLDALCQQSQAFAEGLPSHDDTTIVVIKRVT